MNFEILLRATEMISVALSYFYEENEHVIIILSIHF